MFEEIFNDEYNYSLYELLAENDFYYDEDYGIIYDDTILDELAWDSGATKIILFFDDLVLKKGFKGYIVTNDDSEQETKFIDFNYNAALVEAELYQLAKEQGVSQFFAETVDIGNGVTAQEKANLDMPDSIQRIGFHNFLSNSNYNFDEKEELLFLYRELSNYVSEHPLVELFQQYSVDELEKLYIFLNKYDINDLHSFNSGYFKNGKIKFFDFSGYCSSTLELIKGGKKTIANYAL